MAETKTRITEEAKNEIPRAVTQNSILTIEVDAAIESTGKKKKRNGINCSMRREPGRY